MTLIAGNGATVEEHAEVGILYELRCRGLLVDSSSMRGNRETYFRCGASGPSLHIQILSCHRLDPGTVLDRPDVYCLVLWNDAIVGRTAERENTTNPVWDYETVVVPFPQKQQSSDSGPRGELRIEVYDANTFTRDEFLGQLVLTDFTKTEESDPRVYPLQPKESFGKLVVEATRIDTEKSVNLRLNFHAKNISDGAKRVVRSSVVATFRYDKKKFKSGSLIEVCQRTSARPIPLEDVPFADAVSFEVKHRGALVGVVDLTKDDIVQLIKASENKDQEPAHEFDLISKKKQRAQGTIGLRIIYHTRGSVLRGIDVGVRQMTLGERAVLKIRQDYGFDTAQPAMNIPANAELEAIVDLVRVGDKSAHWIFVKRAMSHRVALWVHRTQQRWGHLREKRPILGALAAPFVFLLISLAKLAGIKVMDRTAHNFENENWSSRDSDEEDEEANTDDDEAQVKTKKAGSPVSSSHGSGGSSDDADFDLLDFDDVITDAEVEVSRRKRLQNAKSLFSGGEVAGGALNRDQLTNGLDTEKTREKHITWTS